MFFFSLLTYFTHYKKKYKLNRDDSVIDMPSEYIEKNYNLDQNITIKLNSIYKLSEKMKGGGGAKIRTRHTLNLPVSLINLIVDKSISLLS